MIQSKKSFRLVTFIAIILMGFTYAKAQHNDFKIDDSLYTYYMQVSNNLKNKDVGLQMTDTLFDRATRINDVKAQCIALYLRVTYYHLQNEYENERKEFHRISPFILKTPYTQYYFGAWVTIITEDINKGKHIDALNNLNEMLDKAQKMKNDYGVMRSYELLGDMYFNINIFKFAIVQYSKALEYGKDKKISDLSSIYIKLGRANLFLRRWKDGEDAILACIQRNQDERANIIPYTILLSIYSCEDNPDTAKVEKTYEQVQNICKRLPLLGNQQNFYKNSLHYYQLFKNDDENIKRFPLVTSMDPDTLADFIYYARKFEREKNYQKSAVYYSKYIKNINNRLLLNEKFLMSSFVPQLEFQKAEHNKEVLLQKQARMQLNEVLSNELMLSLSNERDRAFLLRKQKEHSFLQDQLLTHQLTIEQQAKRINIEKLKVTQRMKEASLIKQNYLFRITAIGILSFLVIAASILFAIRKFARSKRLKTEREHAESDERRKSILFQNMNHEIRNPLNAILGFNDVLNSDLSSGLTEEEKTEFINMISTNSDLLMTLVNDVLDISNFENKTYKINPVDVDILHLCRTTLESLRGKQEHGVEMIFKPGTEKPFILHTDAQRLQQVLINFLSNACKYTEKGHIILSYHVLPDKVRFTVTDTGCGVKPENAEKIFQRFQMLDQSKRGTGLGLNICQAISELLHGKVYLDTSYHQGARFIFDHPLKKLMTLFILVFSSLLPLNAQNNPQGIKDNLYNYYYLKIRPCIIEPQATSMIDTLYKQAQKQNDTKAQGWALLLKVKNYGYLHNNSLTKESFLKCRTFCIQHKLYDYIYPAWTNYFNIFLQEKKYKEAMKQLDEWRLMLNNRQSKTGLPPFYFSAGNLYSGQRQYATAITYYQKALDSGMKDVSVAYSMIGQCYYLLEDYPKAIEYTTKAIENATNSPLLLRYAILIKSFCKTNDARHATYYVNESEENIKKHPQAYIPAVYYESLFYYYRLIKKDKEKAVYALHLSGKEGLGLNDAHFYFREGDYKKSMELFKKESIKATEMLSSDWSDKFDLYESDFNYKRTLQETDRITLDNIRIRLKEAQNKKRLLTLTKEKTRLQLEAEEADMKQKKSSLALQNAKLTRQQLDLQKQKIINASLYEQKNLIKSHTFWKQSLFLTVFIIILLLAIFYVVRLQKKERRLKMEAKKAEDADRKKNIFFSTINHNLRCPLNTIIELNKKLNSPTAIKITEEEKKDISNTLKSAGNYLSTLIDRVLAISKLESGTYLPALNHLHLEEFCQSIVDENKPLTFEGVELEFKGMPYDFTGDAGYLHITLQTYIEALRPYTKKGIITLEYKILSDKILFSASNECDKTSIKDIETVFSFSEISNKDDNLNISLYLIRLFAEQIQGRAFMDSHYKEGLRFIFEYPINA